MGLWVYFMRLDMCFQCWRLSCLLGFHLAGIVKPWVRYGVMQCRRGRPADVMEESGEGVSRCGKPELWYFRDDEVHSLTAEAANIISRTRGCWLTLAVLLTLAEKVMRYQHLHMLLQQSFRLPWKPSSLQTKQVTMTWVHFLCTLMQGETSLKESLVCL